MYLALGMAYLLYLVRSIPDPESRTSPQIRVGRLSSGGRPEMKVENRRRSLISAWWDMEVSRYIPSHHYQQTYF